jgi:IMP dehydrogenase
MKEGITYDDVLLMPGYSEIPSRKEDVDVSTKIGKLKLDIPIISANMDTISGPDMLIAMNALGGLGILHRFMTIEKMVETIEYLKEKHINPIVVAVGVDPRDMGRRVPAVIKAGAQGICVDVAHGHHSKVISAIEFIRPQFDGTIIAGNIATREAARDLVTAGADVLKVGIGPGSLCTTRLITGHGVPQLTAIMDVSQGITDSHPTKNIAIIADGGIKHSGDIPKALAAGANAVMIGSLFAGTNEAASKDVYRGMASREAQLDWKGKVSVVEGEVKKVKPKGPVKDVVDQLVDGIQSGLSYSGASNILELWESHKFIRITHAGLLENRPHGL